MTLLGGFVPFVALPVTPGTVHAASRQPDHANPNERGEAPFASLLDTGTGPRIQEPPTPRADRPRQSERPVHGNTSERKSAPSAAKNESPNAPPEATEAKTDQDQDTAEPGVAIAAAVIAIVPDSEAAPQDAADGADPADTSADKAASTAKSDTAAAQVDIPVVTATIAAPVATPVQPVASDGDAPNTASGAAAAEVAAVAPDALIERAPGANAGKIASKAEKSTDAVAPQPSAKTEKQEAAAPGEDNKADDVKSGPQPKVHELQTQQPIDSRGERHIAAKPKIEAQIDATTSTAPATQTDAASNLTSTVNNLPQPNTPPAGAPVATANQTSQPAIVPVPISGVAVEIVTQAREGKNHFEIRLDPPELGRVDVRLDIDGQGNVTSRLVVERQDTLDLLRRESSALERALHDAGLKTGNDGLQFSLRDQGFNNARRDDTAGRFARVVMPTEVTAGSESSSYRLPRLGGLDIRV